MPTSFVQSIFETDEQSREVKQHNGNPNEAFLEKLLNYNCKRLQAFSYLTQSFIIAVLGLMNFKHAIGERGEDTLNLFSLLEFINLTL